MGHRSLTPRLKCSPLFHHHHRLQSARMATAMPATPETTMPLPDYQVSGAAAAQRHGSGSVGPFFAVLAAVLVLTVLSCFFGRVCAAQAEGPDEWYDCTRLPCRRCWRWRAARRPVKLAEEVKQPVALPLPEP